MGTTKKEGKSKQAVTKAAKQAIFLESIAESGIIWAAAKKSRINRKQHYKWLEEPEYAKAFEAALTESNERLEAEAHRRAHDGVVKPVWYQGKKCGTEREYSDTLIIFLMKGRMPDKYRENVTAKIDLKADVNAKQIIDLSPLSDEQFDALGTLHKAVTGAAGDAERLPGGTGEAEKEQDREVLPGDGAVP